MGGNGGMNPVGSVMGSDGGVSMENSGCTDYSRCVDDSVTGMRDKGSAHDGVVSVSKDG